jgi:hypothetical protein
MIKTLIFIAFNRNLQGDGPHPHPMRPVRHRHPRVWAPIYCPLGN